MKTSILHATVLSSVALLACGPGQTEMKQPGLTGPYLGQAPPGDTPQLFAPGVVADIFREHGSPIFTPDGTEVFWTRQAMTMTEDGRRGRFVVAMHMTQVDGVWTAPALAPFNRDRWNFVTSISPDGRRLYYDASRPTEDGGEPRPGPWIVDKTDDGWAEPRPFDALDAWGMSCAKVQETVSGNLYFTSELPKPDLPNPTWGVAFYRSRWVDGVYTKPELLGPTINTSSNLDYAFHVAPSEEFIIFASDRPGGHSELDLYISFRHDDDSWGEAINLGEAINTHGVGGSDWPQLSPDGRYLFFMTAVRPRTDIDPADYSYEDLRESQLAVTNGSSKIHWVSTRFVEGLKPRR